MTSIEIKIRNGEMEIYTNGHCNDKVTCGAISAIMQTAMLGLINLAENNPKEIELFVKDYREGD